MRSKRFWITCALGLAMVFALASNASAVVHPPDVDPDNFRNCSIPINPFFPLTPGMTWTYQGASEGVATTNITRVTSCTRVIEGVTTTVVHDEAKEGGVLAEDTLDYYAVDCSGNVWYFGEDTMEFNPPSTEGSWISGVDDADAGFIMLANPQVGDRYFQEFAPGVAVDLAKVISLAGSACVPYQNFCSDELLVTKETSQLNPGVAENKFYASGIGFIRGEIVKRGDEFTELVSFTTGSATCP
jgi:hypothetical protein